MMPNWRDSRQQEEAAHDNDAELRRGSQSKEQRKKTEKSEAIDHQVVEFKSKKPLPILPEEMVEMIIAKLPFPGVLKAQLLSISWHRKFFPRTCEVSRCQVLTQFQKEVTTTSVSQDCRTYCPIIISDKGLRGFDRVSNQWKSMFPMCKIDFTTWSWTRMTFSFVGSLMLESTLCTTSHSSLNGISNSSPNVTSIRNVVTGCSIELPPLPQTQRQPLAIRLLPRDSLRSYRVLQIHRVWNGELLREELETALFDSEVGSWSCATESESMSKWIENSLRHYDANNVFLHGKLYCLYARPNYGDNYVLGVYHLDSDPKKWTSAHFSLGRDLGNSAVLNSTIANLLLCGERIMVVIVIHTVRHCRIFIYEVDLEVLGLCMPPVKYKKRAERGDAARSRYIRTRVASDEDFIYIGECNSQSPPVTYNVTTDRWGTLPPPYNELSVEVSKAPYTVMLCSAFTPGLNPFAFVGCAK